MPSGWIPGGCSGCVGVPQCSRPPNTHPALKWGFLERGLGKAWQGRAAEKQENTARRNAGFSWRLGRESFGSFFFFLKLETT